MQYYSPVSNWGKKNDCSSCSGCGDIDRYTDPVKMSAQEGRCRLHVVKLTAADIPGVGLSEPFEAHAIPALRWRLLCRGIAAPQSSKVAELCSCRISLHISCSSSLRPGVELLMWRSKTLT